MQTLYDLLGALPDDDAESVRAAFRKAARANHPDSNPGDPDAPRRFRRIVRANAILSDKRQRAAYDRLLAVAFRQGLKSKRSIFSDTIRKRAADAIAVAVLSVVFIGGYLLPGYVSRVPLVSAQVIEVSAREPAPTAAVISTQLSDTIGRAGPRGKLDDIGAPNKPENPKTVKDKTVKEAAAPNAAAPAENTSSVPSIANVPTARDFGMNNARYYQERGVLAYRRGNLYLAIIDFDLAIGFDPNFSDAYVDRGIVLYRMGEFDRAFADIAQAKRIDDLDRSQTPLPEPQQTSAP